MSKRVLLGACTQNKLGATRHREKTCLDSAKETVVVVPRRKRFNSIQSYVTPLDAASEYAIGSIPGTLGIIRYQMVGYLHRPRIHQHLDSGIASCTHWQRSVTVPVLIRRIGADGPITWNTGCSSLDAMSSAVERDALAVITEKASVPTPTCLNQIECYCTIICGALPCVNNAM